MDYDIKIVGGTIIDGTGSARFAGDVGIRDGVIAALGDAPGNARRTIEADGRIVAPGFVDIHTHYDAQVLWDSMLSISPWHGVTTVVLGNCGFGIAPTRPAHRDLIVRTLEKVEGMSAEALQAGLAAWPFETFPEYLDAVEARGSAINVAVLCGHTPVRLYVMGEDSTERAATAEEIGRMRAIVYEAMDAGAIGFSTSQSPLHIGYGARPVPSRLAEFDETLSLAGALGDAGTGVIQITVGRKPAYDEYVALTEATGRPVSWTALLARAEEAPHYIQRHLARSDELRAAGHEIYPQVSCRPLTVELSFGAPFSLERLSIFAPVSRADAAGKKRIYADPEFRAALKYELDPAGGREREGFAVSTAWRMSAIAICPQAPELEGRKLFEVADERGVDPVDLALDLSLESDFAARFRIPSANNVEDDIEILLQNPNTILGLSDAGAHASQLCDACYATHLLGYWVRRRGALDLERAVHMLTAGAAEVFGITDRGRLAVGRPADVVVFDPETVGAGPLERIHDLPAGAERLISRAHGIDAVIVNGKMLRENGDDALGESDALPGRLLRNGNAAA